MSTVVCRTEDPGGSFQDFVNESLSIVDESKSGISRSHAVRDAIAEGQSVEPRCFLVFDCGTTMLSVPRMTHTWLPFAC